jgi:Myb/SANT-like DNA-binding domain
MPRGRKKAAAGTGNTTELQWTDPMEEKLFNAFLEQHNRGKRADMGWKAEAWAAVIEAVQAAYGGQLVVTKTHCQTKEATYKNHFKDHLYIEKLSGFSWNDELGVFEAAPEAWDELVKVEPPCLATRIMC